MTVQIALRLEPGLAESARAAATDFEGVYRVTHVSRDLIGNL